MIDGSEKHNDWLNLELQSLHVIERQSKSGVSSNLQKFIYLLLSSTD